MRAKKSLGQNFLHSQGALKKIVDAGSLKPRDFVIEIGPGRGALTEKLLQAEAKVVAIEKDRELAEFLKEKFANEIQSGQLKIIQSDVLKENFSEIAKNSSYKIIANIPYNITGEIFRKIFEERTLPKCVVLLVQKEVAERIVAVPAGRQAKEGKESVLSIAVKAYGIPKIIGVVGRGSFTPSPNVDSAILSITEISRSRFEKSSVDESKFFEVLKRGFSMKRKTLENNLKGILTSEQITKASIDPKIRAEKLKTDDWFKLSAIK